jgi:putative transposase
VGPGGVELLFLDESEFHLLPHLVRMWMPRGERLRVPAPGTNRKLPAYGALNWRTGRVSYMVGERKRAAEFLGFLSQLAAEYNGRPCLLVLDNASYHTAKAVLAYLEDMKHAFHVLWLPPYSPELNEIEGLWKYVKSAALANHDFGGVDDLRRALSMALDQLNSAASHNLSLQFRPPSPKNLLEVA